MPGIPRPTVPSTPNCASYLWTNPAIVSTNLA
ncbi:Uncharacterised protein [Vibrio cholerae]|nr:Uncharacterised protein [Vibrio cholerae]CSD58126.1 Uncharacterised protein [Vibrio cholerae]